MTINVLFLMDNLGKACALDSDQVGLTWTLATGKKGAGRWDHQQWLSGRIHLSDSHFG